MTQLHQSGKRPPPQRPVWLWLMTLLCASLLFCASTAQACHAHDGLLRSADGKMQFSAPADECPLCVAPHAALAADTHVTVVGTPQSEAVGAAVSVVSRKKQWHFDLFSRPPPAASRKHATGMTGSGRVS